MRENSNEVMSSTPLKTNTTISKSVTALNEVGSMYPITMLDKPKAVFKRSQETATPPQSNFSKNPTFHLHTMSTFFTNCIIPLFAATNLQNQGGASKTNSFVKKVMLQLAVILFTVSSYAQINNIKFSSAPATYSDLSGGTSLIAGGNVAVGAAMVKLVLEIS